MLCNYQFVKKNINGNYSNVVEDHRIFNFRRPQVEGQTRMQVFMHPKFKGVYIKKIIQ